MYEQSNNIYEVRLQKLISHSFSWTNLSTQYFEHKVDFLQLQIEEQMNDRVMMRGIKTFTLLGNNTELICVTSGKDLRS